MTALGNVLALIRQLDDAAEAPLDGTGSASMQFRDFPAPSEIASSLGAVVAFRRAVDAPVSGDVSAESSQRETRSNIEPFRRIGSAFQFAPAGVRA